jgi:hypothetical protein
MLGSPIRSIRHRFEFFCLRLLAGSSAKNVSAKIGEDKKIQKDDQMAEWVNLVKFESDKHLNMDINNIQIALETMPLPILRFSVLVRTYGHSLYV